LSVDNPLFRGVHYRLNEGERDSAAGHLPFGMAGKPEVHGWLKVRQERGDRKGWRGLDTGVGTPLPLGGAG
jgi:hypothetical protein